MKAPPFWRRPSLISKSTLVTSGQCPSVTCGRPGPEVSCGHAKTNQSAESSGTGSPHVAVAARLQLCEDRDLPALRHQALPEQQHGRLVAMRSLRGGRLPEGTGHALRLPDFLHTYGGRARGDSGTGGDEMTGNEAAREQILKSCGGFCNGGEHGHRGERDFRPRNPSRLAGLAGKD